MYDSINETAPESLVETIAPPLFMWRGAGIVLIGQRDGDRWVLARGWLHGDRLEHVRRWSFAQPIRFSGQVRRLVMEACADYPLAREEGMRALGWVESLSRVP